MARMRTHYNIPKNDDEFELLCLKLLRKRWNCPQLEQFGKRGERQYGIDLIDLSGAEPLRAAQCKLHEVHKTIPPREIEEEVKKAKAFSLPLGIYAILTTAKVSTQTDRKILELNREHAAEGLFTVELLNWNRIEQLLDEYPDVRDEFFGGMDSAQVASVEKKLNVLQLTVGAAITENTGERYNAEIDEGKAALERHEFQLTRLILQRLRQKHWDELTPRQRFRLVSNIGAAWLGEGDSQKAATCFFEAKIYQPEDEKALTNEVLAHYVTGNLNAAFELSNALRSKFPHSALLASLWINSAPPTKSLSELQAETPTLLLSDADVSVAISLRALREFNFDLAEEVLRNIRAGRMEWSVIPGLLARTILGREMHRKFLQANAPGGDPRSRLKEADELFSRAIELATREKQDTAVAEYLLDRAQVRSLIGDKSGWESDVKEAYRLTPSEPAVISMMGALIRSKGDLDGAIEMLRRTAQGSKRIDVRFQLASALQGRGKAGDYREATNLLCVLALEHEVPKVLRASIVGLAIDCYVEDDRLTEARSFVDRLPIDHLTPFATHTFEAQLQFHQNNIEKANLKADDAVSLITGESDDAEIRYLARLLNQLGRHKDALPLWQRLIKPGRPGPEPRHLLETALRLQRYDVVLETCDGFRREGIENPDLLNYEINVLEQFDADAAVRVLQEHLAKEPDDAVARLRLSLIGLRTDNKDLVCNDPSRLPDVSKVTPEGGGAVVHVLKLGGRPDDALVYAYELLRLHFADADAHRAYQFSLLPFGPMPKVIEFEVAGPETAVTYQEEGLNIPHTVVIENSPKEGPRFPDQVSPDGFLARQLAGKRVGDSFILAKGSISNRTAKITRILNKFVYRYQDSMAEWQVRFPEESTMESVQVVKEPGGKVDLSALLATIDRQQEAAKKLEEIYRTQPIPVHMFASIFGKNSFLGTYIIANRRGLKFSCCGGTQEERTQAVDALNVCGEVVLDLSAIATLCLLGIEESLRSFGVSIIVSQATLAELNEMIRQDELSTSESGYFTKVGEQYTFIESTIEEKQQRVVALKKLVELLKSVAKIMPCRDLVAFDAERREILYKAFGQHGAESILLAASPGRLLWTDDFTLARFAAGEHGVRRIWTQVALEYCAATGKVTPDAYFDASAKLLGFEYSFTSSNQRILMSAARLANWVVDAWPFKEALDQFKDLSTDSSGLLQIAVFFTLQLYQEPVDRDTRDLVFMRILDNLSVRLGSKDEIERLLKALPRLFGLNLVGAEQASDCIRRWLSRPEIAEDF
jgi:tetratricopeptide (TPR) repeat protein